MRILAALLIVTIGFTGCKNSTSNSFEGVIEYTITYNSLSAQTQPYVDLLPKQKTVYVSGAFAREDKPFGDGMQSVIIDTNKDYRMMLISMNGKKARVDMGKEYYAKMDATYGKDSITYIDEEKIIAGFTCKKAIAKNYRTGEESTIYYTTEIPYWGDKTYDGLKGFPLYYKASTGDMEFTVEAKKVETKELPESTFTQTDGYEKVTMDELQLMLSEGY